MTNKAWNWQKGFFSLILTLLLLMNTIHSTIASSRPQASVDGEAIFKDKCSRCHTIGGGDKRGPDLKRITQLRDQQWLGNFISNPRQVIASGDETALSLLKKYKNITMPSLGLTQEQVLAVISYLDLSSGIAGTQSITVATTPAATAGTVDNGKALFINDVKLANGGPPCISCHSIDNVGILGGGVLGPNLTQASTKYGNDGLATALAEMIFPTMQPIFTIHPITANEQADLVAFIINSAGQPQPNKEGLILGVSMVGFLLAMAVAMFYWRGRLRNVRQQLLEETKSTNRIPIKM